MPKVANKRESPCKRWCFTINNYTEYEIERIKKLTKNEVQYLIVGKEVGEKGTPHLQGFVSLKNKVRLAGIKKLVGDRAHLEHARGNDLQNKEYCQKDNVLIEIGEPSLTSENGGGNNLRTKFPIIMKMIREEKTMDEMYEEDPAALDLYLRYGRRIREEESRTKRTMSKKKILESEYKDVKWKHWQQKVLDIIDGPIHRRRIYWVLDPVGNMGKTFLATYAAVKYNAFVTENGKTADIKHGYNGERTVIFDLTRSVEDRVNYEVMETIKNGRYFSTKYESTIKISEIPHVIVFANFDYDVTKMSQDRFMRIKI